MEATQTPETVEVLEVPVDELRALLAVLRELLAEVKALRDAETT